jgi:hypothetical protein
MVYCTRFVLEDLPDFVLCTSLRDLSTPFGRAGSNAERGDRFKDLAFCGVPKAVKTVRK